MSHMVLSLQYITVGFGIRDEREAANIWIIYQKDR